MIKYIAVIGVIIVIICGALLFTGDGAFKKKFTMSGIVEIDVANGRAICFVDAEAHGISCIPKSALELKK